MSCFDCRFYTGEDYLACGVDPITAANSPELGCRDWQPNPNPWGFWEVLVNSPHVDDVQIGCVPINGWEQLVCPIVDTLLFEDDYFRLQPIEARFDNQWVVMGFLVMGNSIWRTPQGRVVGYAQACQLEDRDWYLDPDPYSAFGVTIEWFNNLLE